MLFRRRDLRFVQETQGIDYREETSINQLKLSIFVRRHLFRFTRLQGPIWATERVSSSLWPRSKWEAKGVLWVLLLQWTEEEHTHGLLQCASRCGPHQILCPAPLPPLKESREEEKMERRRKRWRKMGKKENEIRKKREAGVRNTAVGGHCVRATERCFYLP